MGVSSIVLVGAASLDSVRATIALAAEAVAATLTLATALWSRRPKRAIGWWLVVVGITATVTANATSLAATGRPVWITSWAVAPGIIATLVLFIVGVVHIAQIWLADVLDATLVALALSVAAYVFVLQPRLAAFEIAILSGMLLPFESLLVLALMARALLTLRRPSPCIFSLFAGMAGVGVSATLILLPWVSRGAEHASTEIKPWWLAWCTLFGVAGLLPTFGEYDFSRKPAADSLSRGRVLLFISLAVIVPVAWFGEIVRALTPGHDRHAFFVPIVGSAVLLLVLVWRLVLLALTAQRQTEQLNAASAELRLAFREQHDLQHQLRHQAMHDPLTGLPNRLVLHERMEWALRRAVLPRRHLSVALLDLDRFKDVNDTMGHPVGDELLIEVSRRLLEGAPQTATVGRLGGDEFVAVLEDSPPEQARSWAEQVRRTVTRPFHVENHDLYLTTSIGICNVGMTGPLPTTSEVLRNADIALYAAKARGKNRVEVFRPELHDERLHYTQVSTGLRRALAGNEFVLHYQPVVDLTTRKIVAVEALLRWIREGQPDISPEEFVPVAEESGMIIPIGRWVIRQACLDAKSWFDRGIVTAVNASVYEFNNPEFADFVIQALRDNELPGHALTIEITESGLVTTSTLPELIRHLDRLRERGVRIAIDDFGVGYSSLSYFAALPVDLVKIDKSLIPRSSVNDRINWAVPRAILELAETLNLDTVAEGVETLEQAEMLRAIRCRHAQGYLFARPLPREVMLTHLLLSQDDDADKVG